MSLETLLLIVAVLVAGVFNVILPWLKKLQEDARAGSFGPWVPGRCTPWRSGEQGLPVRK